MEYKKIEKSNYNLHLIKTDKFKTLTVRIYFRNKIEKNEIVLRNMLTRFLAYSTDTYPTKRDIIFKCQDLYAAEVYTSGNRVGNGDVFTFTLSILNEKYTEKGMMEESIKFLHDIIYNPNFNNDKYYEAAYNFLYKQYERNLMAIKDNKSSYSTMRMLEEMNDGNRYNYRSIGYLEDLKSITKDTMINFYNKIITSSLVDVYIIGNIDNSVEELIDKYFKFESSNNNTLDIIIKHSESIKDIKVIEEEDDNSQSKLAIGCKLVNINDFERRYVSNLYNSILGGSSESKFFKIIREENSLSYYTNSGINKLDGLLIIKAGIAASNYDKVLELIKKLMKDISDGNFTLEDIKVAQENYIAGLNELEDNPESIIDMYTGIEIFGLDDIDERKKKILEVTKEDIINFSKKVEMDTIFLLKGIGEENG